MCDSSLQGTPGSDVTREYMQKHIEVENSRYYTISYDASEYVLDDKSRLIIHNNVIGISRTRLYDSRGDRIYDINYDTHLTLTKSKI